MGQLEEVLAAFGHHLAEVPQGPPRAKRQVLEVGVLRDEPATVALDEREEEVLDGFRCVEAADPVTLLRDGDGDVGDVPVLAAIARSG